MLQELLDAIKDNCQLCQLMLGATKDEVKHRFGVATNLGSFQGQVWIRLKDKDRWGFHVEMPISDNNVNMHFAGAKLELFQIGSTAVELDGSSGSFVRAEIDSSPIGERAMMLVQQWLRHCLNNHPKCVHSWGLWTNDLIRGLLWARKKINTRKTYLMPI